MPLIAVTTLAFVPFNKPQIALHPVSGKINDFVKVEADADEREKIRAQIVANYVAANDLNFTAIKDYGWDPVTLPEENIDTFYSNL